MHPSKQTVRLATLNLWGFKDWEHRFPTIVSILQNEMPDVVCTQETQRGIDGSGPDQLEQLKGAVGYPHAAFFKARLRMPKNGDPFQVPLEHGIGILSRYPIEDIEIVPLAKAGPDDTEERITVYFSITKDGLKQHVAAVHFSNRDDWALNHLHQVLDKVKKDARRPIMGGDFNIFSMTHEIAPYGDLYVNSYDVKKYISFPEDNDTLDYILIPKTQEFSSIECLDDYVSDHRILSVTITDA